MYPNFTSLLRSVSILAAVFMVSMPRPVSAENLPLDHAGVTLVKDYLAAVVSQDWKTASKMLLPNSLERKQRETISIIKTAPTMTEENEMLQKLGAKDISELEKMSPQEFYAADRRAVHDKMNISPEIKKKKQDTLKINVISLGGEDENRVIHAVVRTSQETLESKIEELFLISMVQDKDNAKAWLIVPDMMRPITTPLQPAK